MKTSCSFFSLRKVTEGDMDLLFKWANDPVVRKWSFSKQPITLEEHKCWFDQKYNDPNTIMWILEESTQPSGVVRFEKSANRVLLNYLIAPEARGKKLASKMLLMSIDKLEKFWKGIDIIAYSLPENVASIKSLKKVGFCLLAMDSRQNSYVLQRNALTL